MIPVLFEIGPFKLHSFGLMMALAFLAATLLAARRFRKLGLDPDRASERLGTWEPAAESRP